jgi:thymidylate synthase
VEFRSSNIGFLWNNLLRTLELDGEPVSPRDQGTREIREVTLILEEPLSNVLVDLTRKPSYRFMVAEWLWILAGRDDVASIGQYNKHIIPFSDDGIKFAGAYGPPLVSQWRVLDKMIKDPDTRQAIIQIFPQEVPFSKDVPCTLSFQFFIRNDSLEMKVNMRSSDVWLGLPYDIFNFTMIGNVVAGQFGLPFKKFSLNIGSSHLYERDREKAKIAFTTMSGHLRSPAFTEGPPAWLDHVLVTRSMGSLNVVNVNRSVWLYYGAVLCAESNSVAYDRLQDLHNYFR